MAYAARQHGNPPTCFLLPPFFSTVTLAWRCRLGKSRVGWRARGNTPHTHLCALVESASACSMAAAILARGEEWLEVLVLVVVVFVAWGELER